MDDPAREDTHTVRVPGVSVELALRHEYSMSFKLPVNVTAGVP